MDIDEFKVVVSECHSIYEIVDKLGYSKTSGSMAKIVKQRISTENISTDHFKRKNVNQVGGKPVYSLDEILVENSFYTNIYRLKIRLLSGKVLDYKCSICQNDGMWCGNPLTLQLDHINGIPNDHRIENLRFLCPNCHSQTETFSGRNAKKQ